MPQNRVKEKDYIPGKVYHLYNRGNRKQLIFNFPSDRKYYVEKLLSTADKFGIEVIAYCLMDNHFHLVLRQGYLETISQLMHRVNTAYSLHFNCKYSLVGHLFQGKLQSRPVYNITSLLRLLEYVRNNPVKEGLVKDPYHYAWLSINDRYCEMYERT